jgi:hypothetical protein
LCVFGIATCCGWMIRGSNFRGGRNFSPPYMSRLGLGKANLPCSEYHCSFKGEKRPLRGFDHLTPSSSEIKMARARLVPLLFALIYCCRMIFSLLTYNLFRKTKFTRQESSFTCCSRKFVQNISSAVQTVFSTGRISSRFASSDRQVIIQITVWHNCSCVRLWFEWLLVELIICCLFLTVERHLTISFCQTWEKPFWLMSWRIM